MSTTRQINELRNVLFWITHRKYGGTPADGTRWLGTAAELAALLNQLGVSGAPTDPRRLGRWLRRQVAAERCHHTVVRFRRRPKTGCRLIEVTARPDVVFSPTASALYSEIHGTCANG